MPIATPSSQRRGLVRIVDRHASQLWIAALASCLLCSCASPPNSSRAPAPASPAGADALLPPLPAASVDQKGTESTPQVAEATPRASETETPSETIPAAPQTAPPTDTYTAVANTPRDVEKEAPGTASVSLVQHSTTSQETTDQERTGQESPVIPASNSPIVFTAADRRIDDPAYAGQACPIQCPPHHVAGCPGTCPPNAPCGAGQGQGAAMVGVVGGMRHINSDEYLCDGGDRGLPVHYDNTYRNGLNTEDTVGEWTSPGGQHHVTPSNKTCVYAPRFGEVRSFSVPVGGTKVDMLVSANEFQRGAGLNARMHIDTEIQKTRLDAARVRTRASGILVENSASGYGQVVSAALNLRDVPPVVGTAFLTRGVLTRGEEAYLADSIRAAGNWTRAQFPIISATDVSSQEVRAEFRAAEIIGLEDMNKPGHLRIVKLADRTSAKTGEEVTFTIRYDNLGDKPIHHVKIVDNLTPRLDFVEESGTSDRPGRLDIEPNGEGSFVLTFVIDGALEGKTGGTVSFKARVK